MTINDFTINIVVIYKLLEIGILNNIFVYALGF